MFKFKIIILLMISLPATAQNRLNNIIGIQAGENYPTEMPVIRNWIETALSKTFMYDFQFSKSLKEDAGFISFAFISRAPFSIILPSTDSIKLNFENVGKTQRGITTQHYNIEYKFPIKAYIPSFKPEGLKYDSREYYAYAINIAGLNDAEVVANTLNRMVDRSSNDKAIKIFIDVINKSQKLKLPYPKEDSVKELLNIFKEKNVDVKNTIYNTFIKDKTKTSKKLNIFFTGIGMFYQDVEHTIDVMRCFTLKGGMKKVETIAFPITIMTREDTVKDSPALFEYKFFEGTLDYKNKSLEIRFKGNFTQPILLANGKKKIFNFKTSKNDWKIISNEKIAKISELILAITEKKLTIEAITEDRQEYILIENKLK